MTPAQATPNDEPRTAAAASPWARLHAALMPDYNAKATVYWWSVVALGVTALAVALWQLSDSPPLTWAQIAAGMAIAMLAGFFPVRIPHTKSSFAAGEVFIFLVLLMHGPAAATLAAAGETAVGAWRSSKRWTSRIGSPAMSALAMYAAGSMLYAVIEALNGLGWFNDGVLMVAAMAFSLGYFVLNAVLVTALPLLKRNERLLWSHLVGVVGWIGFAYAGSAAVAALLMLAHRQSGMGVLLAVVPLLGALLAAFHYYNRQQEANAAAREAAERAAAREAEAAASSAAREAELAARHLRELQASERHFHSAFTHASIGMALVSFDGRILQINPSLRALLGVDADADVEQQLFSEFVLAGDSAALNQHLLNLKSQDAQSFAIDLRLCHRGGAEVWATVHGSLFSDIDSATPCLILQVQDITARRNAESGLHHIAFHDSLTGLPNRRRFNEVLAQTLERAQAEPKRHFALMFLDFDRFKLINDSLGHAAGDEFLVQVARRIQDQVRPGDTVARLGGDEFAVLAEHAGNERAVVPLAERLMAALRQPFQVAGNDLNTSASIGITFSSMGYSTPADMLRDADIAMYKAKSAGKDRYTVFDAALHSEVSHRLRLEGDLRRALAEGQLSVVYQPMFELNSGRVTGFEALARWDHPELGAVSPETFIAVAEDSGLIVPLTDFVLRRACAQLRQWHLRDPEWADLYMHVNLSGLDLTHPGLVARVTAALVEAHLEPQHLSLELTENILMERLEGALATLQEIRRLGIGLSVDDFGTGYSSLRHLSNLPVNSLKIDRAFIADLQRNSNDAAVVRSIVLLGHSLGKLIVAEGVETAAQMEQLRQMGCTLGQGFHLARPLVPELIDKLLDGLAARKAHLPGTQAVDRPALFH